MCPRALCFADVRHGGVYYGKWQKVVSVGNPLELPSHAVGISGACGAPVAFPGGAGAGIEYGLRAYACNRGVGTRSVIAT